MTSLPDKPSELIRLAIADLEKCEADPRYAIDMGEWHTPHKKCKVCLAGAVMAQTFKENIRRQSWPGAYGPDNRKFVALDAFRAGFWISGLAAIGLSADALPDNVAELFPAAYAADPAAFKADMLRAADILAEAGL